MIINKLSGLILKAFTATLLSLSVLCCILLATGPVQAQEKKYQAAVIGFYNLENLFDTINDPIVDEGEFLPTGTASWDGKKYQSKLSRLAEAISQVGADVAKEGPVILGMSEAENKGVVEDLIHTGKLKDRNYGIVHYDSPDRRGIDVALIYQAGRFQVTDSKPLHLFLEKDTSFRTRDILLVHGKLDGDELFVLVNHWPSRRGGEQSSAWLRNAAADLARHAIDSIYKINPSAKIILMGDLNDDPINKSLTDHLKAKPSPEKTGPGDMYNPMYKLFRNGIGSLAYRDSWNLFDQIVISQPLLDKQSKGYIFYQAFVFNRSFLIQKEGQYAGYPYRTYASGTYIGGYSDHFPVYVVLVREVK